MPLFILAVFFSPRLRNWLRALDPFHLTVLHTVRIPVELVLFWLFGAGYIPEVMTFAGNNFDILAGLTAPIVAVLVFRTKIMGRGLFLAWNLFSLLLLANIIVTAILSAPTIFQRIAFEQPNEAVFFFPFLLLPAIIVPLVLFAHIACILQYGDMKDQPLIAQA